MELGAKSLILYLFIRNAFRGSLASYEYAVAPDPLKFPTEHFAHFSSVCSGVALNLEELKIVD
jgi:hypothetical protein